MRTFAYAVLCTLMLAPAALAEYNESKPDCPPDMFCTTQIYETSIQDENGAEADGDVNSDAKGEVKGEAKGASASTMLAALGALAIAFLARR